ncbi:MAG: hypothetical protein KC561_08445, partial [Myxococcales bacterium]|nr:hypothetical protein [Myxococcales bacterium]
MSLSLLTLGIVAAILALNAYRPVYWPGWLALSSFFAGWLTTEAAIQTITWQFVLALILVVGGALSGWPGLVGLALCVCAWTALALEARAALGSSGIIERGLQKALGEDYAQELHETAHSAPMRVDWPYVLKVFPIRRRGVVRHRNIQYQASGQRRHRL